MDTNLINQGAGAQQPQTPGIIPDVNGKWVPVDASQLNFSLNGAEPNRDIIGPDGARYRVMDSGSKVASIAANAQNAIPTPSSIVQMPPIVQPIALVPFTSQNQPLLQYDPYSRPVEPQVTEKAPSYVRKPYRGISLAALIISAIALIVLLLLGIGAFKENAVRGSFATNGIDQIKSVFGIFGLGVSASYYDGVIADLKGADLLFTVMANALPFLVLVAAVLFIVLIVRYLVALIRGKSPRGFSVCAFLNIILCVLAVVALLVLSNGYAADKSANIGAFFTFGDAPVLMREGLLIALVLSIVLFVLPFFAKRNAYMLEEDRNAKKKTYIIDDSNI